MVPGQSRDPSLLLAHSAVSDPLKNTVLGNIFWPGMPNSLDFPRLILQQGFFVTDGLTND